MQDYSFNTELDHTQVIDKSLIPTERYDDDVYITAAAADLAELIYQLNYPRLDSMLYDLYHSNKIEPIHVFLVDYDEETVIKYFSCETLEDAKSELSQYKLGSTGMALIAVQSSGKQFQNETILTKAESILNAANIKIEQDYLNLTNIENIILNHHDIFKAYLEQFWSGYYEYSIDEVHLTPSELTVNDILHILAYSDICRFSFELPQEFPAVLYENDIYDGITYDTLAVATKLAKDISIAYSVFNIEQLDSEFLADPQDRSVTAFYEAIEPKFVISYQEELAEKDVFSLNPHDAIHPVIPNTLKLINQYRDITINLSYGLGSLSIDEFLQLLLQEKSLLTNEHSGIIITDNQGLVIMHFVSGIGSHSGVECDDNEVIDYIRSELRMFDVPVNQLTIYDYHNHPNCEGEPSQADIEDCKTFSQHLNRIGINHYKFLTLSPFDGITFYDEAGAKENSKI